MKLHQFFTIITLLFFISITAQETKLNQSIDSGTIENQFDYVINKSNRYQDYKVVKHAWLNRLKRVVNDSLNILRKELSDTKITLNQKENEITTLTNSLNTTEEKVVNLNDEKDNIRFFGSLISKPLYNTILWSIIGFLLVSLLIYIFRFNQSSSITKDYNEKFVELDKEFEEHRQRSLEREQQLRRKLQDEINKQKKDK